MVRSRPLSSSQTTTPHHNQPTPHGDSRPRRAPVRRPPSGGRGGQGTQQHARTRPRRGATTVPRQHARHTQGRPPRHHARHQNDILRRKEVIQPHLPIRLPCYDFTPITSFTFGGVLLSVRLPTSGPPGSHGVTGGVYKARERIHRIMLICDY